MNRTGAQIVMEALAREGVEVFFGYPGGVVLPLYDEMLNWPTIKHILVRHEQCAAHMADGYARATGKVGVCLGTSGPGATNLVTGIATAMMDSIPMVVLTGQVNNWAIGKDAFQETDVLGITLPITKHNYLVKSVDDLPAVVAEAFRVAQSGRKGPVLVDIPKDVFIAKTSNDFPADMPNRDRLEGHRPNERSIDSAARLLATAERPVIIAGAGVQWSGTEEALRELAEKCDVPVVNSLLGLGTIPRNDERSMGMMGMHGEAAATRAVQEADLVIGIGIRFDDRLTGKTDGFAPQARIIHFDVDPCEFGKTVPTLCRVQGDLLDTLPAFVAAAPCKKHTEWRAYLKGLREAMPIMVPEDGRLLARNVISTLSKVTGGEAIVSTDVGQHQMWTAQLYNFKRTYQWLTSGGLGTMGFGFPAAMGAKFACPNEEVWAVVGDGGFQMTLQELQTVAECNLDVKVCLINNGYLGMVRQWQEMFYDNRYSHVAIGSPDYAKLSAAYGVKFLRCTRREDLEETLREAREHQGPVLCEFVVEMEENVFPMVAAGATNDNVVMDPALKQLQGVRA